MKRTEAVTTKFCSELDKIWILSLDWNFWPFLGIFGEVRKCVKWTISFCFANHIWFYFWHLSLALRFYAAPPHIDGLFRNCYRDFWSFNCESPASQVRQCPNWIRGGSAEYLGSLAKYAQTRIGCVTSFAVKFFWDSLVTSNSLMKYKEQRAQNIPLLTPMKEATHLNLAAIQLE